MIILYPIAIDFIVAGSFDNHTSMRISYVQNATRTLLASHRYHKVVRWAC
jgi:hypothetical protein